MTACRLTFVAAIGVLSRGRSSEWGLNLRKQQKFFGGIVGFRSNLFTDHPWVERAPVHSAESRFQVLVRSDPRQHVGWLTYMWIFVGPSEEILFRGLIHTYLSKSWTGSLTVARVSIPWAGIVATVIFCLAHIDSVHINWAQQLFAFGLGIYYSTMYERTGSLLNPILAHNYSDGIINTAEYAVYFWLR